MMKRFKFLILLAWVTTMVTGQIYEPVKWSHELKITGKTSGEIIHKATIEGKWHMYGMDIPEGGPRPTRFVYENLQHVELDGKVVSKSKLTEIFDKNFNMNLSWYDKEALFVQKLKLKDGTQIKVEGYVEYMACDDEQCLPPDQDEFSLSLSITAPAAAKSAQTASPINTTNTANQTDNTTPII
jgi:hypothetical protein